jgi:Fe-Mn family superoxide dismutase
MLALQKLPYDYDALEPIISERALRVHHQVHHKGYVDKLNASLRDYPELLERAGGLRNLLARPADIPSEIKEAVINFGGGVFTHDFFWQSLTPLASMPEDIEFYNLISDSFGSVSRMLKEMVQQGKKHFGSGWVWLVLTQNRELAITTTKNQDTPMMRGHTPLLTFDLWEHAYYLDYLAEREKFLNGVTGLVNWRVVESRFRTGEV